MHVVVLLPSCDEMQQEEDIRPEMQVLGKSLGKFKGQAARTSGRLAHPAGKLLVLIFWPLSRCRRTKLAPMIPLARVAVRQPALGSCACCSRLTWGQHSPETVEAGPAERVGAGAER